MNLGVIRYVGFKDTTQRSNLKDYLAIDLLDDKGKITSRIFENLTESLFAGDIVCLDSKNNDRPVMKRVASHFFNRVDLNNDQIMQLYDLISAEKEKLRQESFDKDNYKEYLERVSIIKKMQNLFSQATKGIPLEDLVIKNSILVEKSLNQMTLEAISNLELENVSKNEWMSFAGLALYLLNCKYNVEKDLTINLLESLKNCKTVDFSGCGIMYQLKYEIEKSLQNLKCPQKKLEYK